MGEKTLLSLARAGDSQAREALVGRLLPLARSVARRFETAQHPAEDLTQVAGLGLIKALDRFDPARDVSLGTYAHALMTGEVRRHIRDSRMIRIPRPIYEEVPRFQRTFDALR